ncbi:ABC transporter ATP-binding protein [Sulfitobacter pacificus]|uniref:ABC transporter ATP-binding protein n=1 Tax=Sulfitobacter pacificus TaxID=1499314 RepID=UPI003106DC58
MSVSHLYESFSGRAASPTQQAEQAEDEFEDVKLNAFESGYQAGWEDALKAQGDAENKLTEEFLQNLQDLSFTYHEALSKLSVGMKPLMSAIVTKLLPQVAAQSLGPQIIEQFETLIKDQSDTLVEVAVAPDKQPVIEALLKEQETVPFTVVAEPALSAGQVYLRAGQTEREINLDAVLEGITSGLAAFFHTVEQENKHG